MGTEQRNFPCTKTDGNQINLRILVSAPSCRGPYGPFWHIWGPSVSATAPSTKKNLRCYVLENFLLFFGLATSCFSSKTVLTLYDVLEGSMFPSNSSDTILLLWREKQST